MSNIIKFAHLADLHLGAYREKKLTQLNLLTFQKAISKIIERDVDFCIFAGDIFNNAMPQIEIVTSVIDELVKLKKRGIPIYIVGGSHDYSVTRKNYLELLEKAELVKNVANYSQIDKHKIEVKFTVDERTGTRLCGVEGKKNELEKATYERIVKPRLNKDNLNIFLFHTTLNDFKPDSLKNFKAQSSISTLPAGFDFYAGGHIHTPMLNIGQGYAISYSGALFPNNFKELRLETPGFNFCSFDRNSREMRIKRYEVKTYEKEYVFVDVDKLNPVEAKNRILEKIEKYEFYGRVVLLEISGIIEGKTIDIGLNKIVKQIYDLGANIVLKNTYKLRTSYLENLDIPQIDENEAIEKIESLVIEENIGDIEDVEDVEDRKNQSKIIKELLSLNLMKLEGEKVAQYEEKVIDLIDKVLD